MIKSKEVIDKNTKRKRKMNKNRKRMKQIIPKWINIVTLCILIYSNNFVFANLEDNEVINVNEITEEVQTSSTLKNELNLNSRIALIYDRHSGKVLYEKNGNKQTPMASTTKIMTAIVVIENCDLKDVVTIDAKAAGVGGSRLGLKKNDKITVNDLLYGLMLRSGNDAAIALAIHVGESVSGFAEMMNQKAIELGLTNSHFVVPHGLDMEGHYTTAYELAKMANYALNIPKLKEIVGTKSYTVTINGQSKVISNTNELLGNLNGVYGVKTGFTNGAGRCLVTACKRDKIDIITVVLGADTKKIRTIDSMKLIEYANKNYQMVNIKSKIGEEFEKWKKLNQGRISINKGVEKNIELQLEELDYEIMAVKNTQIDNITVEINTLYYLEAPIEENKVIGNLKIMIGKDTVDILNIYNKQEIRKKEIKDYMLQFIKLMTFPKNLCIL